MYIWIGIDVDNQLEKIKTKAIKIEKDLNFLNSNFTLPLHISFKITFLVDENIHNDVINTILDYYYSLKEFDVETSGIENFNSIIWIKMKQNNILDKIHDDLNDLLLKKYNIGLHPYDLDYLFHTTLFMEGDEEKINKAYQLIKDEVLPNKLTVNKLVIGTSQTGKLGSYSIYKTVNL